MGTPETFPLYHPAGEGRSGKISIAHTLSPEAQLKADDYAIPGMSVPVATAEKHLSSHREGGAACSGRDVLYLSYRVN